MEVQKSLQFLRSTINSGNESYVGYGWINILLSQIAQIAQNIAETCQKYFQSLITIEI